jgi:hypothetical protein
MSTLQKLRVAGVSLELVFLGAHQLDASLFKTQCAWFVKVLYLKVEHPKLYQCFRVFLGFMLNFKPKYFKTALERRSHLVSYLKIWSVT